MQTDDHRLCAKLGKMFAGKEKLLIPIFITVFAVGGFTMGMSVEVLVFVPIGIAVAKAVAMIPSQVQP